MPTRKLRVKEIPHHDSDMAACYLLTNPRDSSINVTGFPVNGQYNAALPSRSANRNVSSAVHGHNSVVPGSAERYVPVLTVKRQAGPTTVTAPASPLEDSGKDISSQHGERSNQGGKPFAFGRPVPPVDCFQSRTPIAQRVRNCSRSLAGSTTHRPLTDLRTGFMRTMSKPTPGELDLKLHQEKQALDKLKADLRREQAAMDDPDKLDMNNIIRLVDEKHIPSYAHHLRPRAAKRRVAHTSLVSGMNVESRSQIADEIADKELKAQKAISEYKHRLHVLSAQMRSSRERSQSAVTRHTSAGVEKQSLRLAPNHSDRLMSIQLLSLPDPNGRSSPQGSIDGYSSRSYPIQSRLTPRGTTASSLQDLASASSGRSRHILYPDPIYIPSGSDESDVTHEGDDTTARVKLSMRSTSNVTRETSLMSDMDPRNSAKILSARVPFPQPTVPPSNTPVSDGASDDELANGIDDDDSLETNFWSSRSCSRLSPSSAGSPRSRSTTPSVSRPSRSESRQSKKTEIKIIVPSVSI